MRIHNIHNLVLVGSVLLALFGGSAQAAAQPPGQGKGGKQKGPKGPLDEEQAILKEIKEAYKAPFEVPKDLVKELRKAIEQPSPEREAKVFKEARRMYLL